MNAIQLNGLFRKAIENTKLLVLSVIFFGVCETSIAQTLTNGSFTNAIGADVVASGWSKAALIPPQTAGENTPDINDAVNPLQTSSGFSWSGGAPSASTDGGTFQCLIGSEGVTQTVSGLTSGASYTLTFYYSGMGITSSSSGSYTTAGAPRVSIDGGTNYVTPTVLPLFQWGTHSLTFVASGTSAVIVFRGPVTSTYGAIDGVSLVANCAAGTTAPPLTGTTITNTCPATTVNLNSLHTATVPSGAKLVWFTNNAHTGSPVANPAAVSTAGTYYAFYANTANTCYSPASSAVTVTISNCCNANGGTIIRSTEG